MVKKLFIGLLVIFRGYRRFWLKIRNKTEDDETDGSVRVIVAHSDPGVPNWINTVNHFEGTMCWRWLKADKWVEPNTKVVKLEDLSS